MNIKKLFYLLLVLSIFIFGLKVCSWADVYGFYSEHYSGFEIDSDVTADEGGNGGVLEYWQWAGTNTDPNFFGADTQDFREGTESLKTDDPDGSLLVFGFWEDGDIGAAKGRKTKDLSAYRYIRFDIKASTNVAVQMETRYSAETTSDQYKRYLGHDTGGVDGLNLSDFVYDNQWHTVVIDTHTLTSFECNFSSFSYIGFGTLHMGGTFYIDNLVFVTTPTVNTITVYPETNNFIVPQGYKKLFRAEGFFNSDLIAVSPPVWATSVSGGSVQANTKTYETMFTAPASAQTGNVQASTYSVTGTRNIVVSSITWVSAYHIYTDVVRAGNGDINISKDDNSTCSTSTDTARTGSSGAESLKVDYDLDGSSSWAQIFIQSDTFEDITPHFSTQTAIVNFWVKTSTDLAVSMRSQNITSGTEQSKIHLAEYGVTTDNTWQEVSIIIDDFAQRDSRINFSSVTVLFNIGPEAEYSGTGSGTFWVDDISYKSPNQIATNFSAVLKDVETHATTDQMRWNNIILPDDWSASSTYIELTMDNYTGELWGIQIYTDNTDANSEPRWNTSAKSTASYNCAGLLAYDSPTATSTIALPICWRIVDSTTSASNLTIEEISTQTSVKLATSTLSSYYVWNWLKDKKTPDNAGTADINELFVNGEDAVTVWSNDKGAQHAEGDWIWYNSPNYVYIGALFRDAATPRTYETGTLRVEFYTE
ncbi:hypothetical protein ACFL4O_02885 [bacterium]